jgi:hypothetical protein
LDQELNQQETDMKKLLPGLAVMLLASAGLTARAADRWLHVRVDDQDTEGERVRVNIPLELAERVVPCIHSGRLYSGKVKIEGELGDVDIRSLMDAVRSAPDGEFVTVESREENVRVAKKGGVLLVKVREKRGAREKSPQTVDVKVPFRVVEALVSSGTNELDITAALRTLKTSGDTDLVSVNDGAQTVHIWLDSKSTAE